MADYSSLSLDQLGELLRTEQQKDAQRGWLTPERAAQYQQVFGLFEKVKGQQQFFAARDANRAQTGGIPALGPDFVAPEAGTGFSFGPAQWDSFGNLRETPRAAAREAILSVPSMGQAIGRHALGAMSSPFAPHNVGARLGGIEPQYPGTEAIPGYQAAEDLKTGMRGSGMLATPEAEQGSFTAQFGAGAGSVLPQVGLAFATQGAGLAPEAAGFLSAAMGGLQSSQGVYDEAIQRGMDPTKAQQASSAAGAFTGLTSVVPGMYAQQRLARAMMPGAAAGPTGFIEQALARGAATKLGAVGAPIMSGGIEEGVQETGDQLFQNWLLGKPISSDLAETAVISTALGGAMGSAGSVGAIKELDLKTKDAEATANRQKAMQVGQALSQVNTQEELGKLLSSLPQDVRENSDVQMMVRVRAEQIMSAAALDPTMAGMDTGTGFQVEGVPDPLAQSQVDLNPLAPEIEQMAEMSDVPNVPLTPEAEQQAAADSQQAAPEYAQQQRLEAEQEARTQEAIDAQMDAEIADRKQQLFESQRRERETAKLERQMARDDKKTKAIENAGISQEIQTENDLAVQAKEEALSDLPDPMLQHLVDNAPSMVTKRAAMNLLEKRQRPTIAPGAEPGAKTEPTAQKPPDGLPFAPPVDDDIPPRPPPSGPAPTIGPPFDTSPPLDNKDDMTQPMPAPPAGRIRRDVKSAPPGADIPSETSSAPAESVAAPQPTPSQPATIPAETPASTPQWAATEPDEKPEPPSVGTVGVPMTVTRDMKQRLLDRGFARAHIDKMTPAQAHEALTEPDERPKFSVRRGKAPGLYSGLRKLIDQKMPNRANADQVRAIISSAKKEEVEWTGLGEWLDQQKGPVTKEQVQKFLDENDVQIEEVELSDKPRGIEDGVGGEVGRDTRYGTQPNLLTPGGENQRELLLTLPVEAMQSPETRDLMRRARGGVHDLTADEANQLPTRRLEGSFTQGHYSDHPNVLAHVRFNDRTGPDGEKILHIEEIQSDWHQQGKKYGYDEDSSVRAATFAVPPAPFKATWHELAFKRMLRYAAEHGYDKLTWTTGEQQADRYDLSKQVDSIEVIKSGGKSKGLYEVMAVRDGARVLHETGLTPEKLAATVGKEIAERATTIERPGERMEFSGADLKVGGEGMRGFYDKMIPDFARKYGKKWGAAVGSGAINTADGVRADSVSPDIVNGIMVHRAWRGDGWQVSDVQDGDWSAMHGGSFDSVEAAREYRARKIGSGVKSAHSIDITPQMRESVMGEGQPKFVPKRSAPTRITEADLRQMRDEALKAVGIDPKFVEQLRANPNSAADQRALEPHGKSGDVDLAGMFMDSAITIALDQSAEEAIKANRHEIGHAFLELLRKANPALAVAVIEDIGQKHPKTGLETKKQRAARLEEAFSDTLAAWWSGSYKGPRPALLKAFQMIRGFIDRIGAKLREMGFTKAADVLGTERGARNRRLAKTFHEAAEGKYAPKQANGDGAAKFSTKGKHDDGFPWFDVNAKPGSQLGKQFFIEWEGSGDMRWVTVTADRDKKIRYEIPDEHTETVLRQDFAAANKRAYDNTVDQFILEPGESPAWDMWKDGGIALDQKDAGEAVKLLKRGGLRAVEDDAKFSPKPDQTETPAFRKWFGASKVVDADGKPLVVYHGTSEKFTVFDKSRVSDPDEGGFFFTTVPELAQDYGDRVVEAYLSIKNPYEISYSDWQEGKGLKPAAAKRKGYDGYKITDFDSSNSDEIFNDSGDAYVAFEPTQIKSATGNSGAFDATNPDIRFSPKRKAPGAQSFEGMRENLTLDSHLKKPVHEHGYIHTLSYPGNTLETIREAWEESKAAGRATPGDFVEYGAAIDARLDALNNLFINRSSAKKGGKLVATSEEFDAIREERNGLAQLRAEMNGPIRAKLEAEAEKRFEWARDRDVESRVKHSSKSPISMSPGAEFTIAHGDQGDKRARYVEFKDGKHHYEYWSDTDQKWKPESRSDEALRKAMFTAPRTFTSAAQVPVSPQVQKGAQTMNALLAQYGIPPVTPTPAIPGQNAGPLPSAGPMPGSAPAVPAGQPGVVVLSSTVPPGYSKWWTNVLMSGGGYISTLGRPGKMLADYVQFARDMTARWTGNALREIDIAKQKAKKAKAWGKGEEANLLLVVEKHDIAAEIAAVQAELAATPQSDAGRRLVLNTKLKRWNEAQSALGYSPTQAPAATQEVADAISTEMRKLYDAFRKVAFDKAAGVRKDYAPHYVADWVLDEVKKGTNKSPLYAAILDDTARRIIAAQQKQIANGTAKGPLSTKAEALQQAQDFFGKESASHGDGQLTKRMGSFELKRSDILDPAFLDYSVNHLEHYFNDGALRLAQYAVLSENDGTKITLTPEQALQRAVSDINSQFGESSGAGERAAMYVKAADELLSQSGEDPLVNKAASVVTGSVVLFRLFNVSTQFRNWLGALSLSSVMGVTRSSPSFVGVLIPGSAPIVGPWAKMQREKGIRAGAIPGVMTPMLYNLNTTADSKAGRFLQKTQQGALNLSQGKIERVNRWGTQAAGSMLAQSMAKIMRGDDPSAITRMMRNAWEFGPLMGASQKWSAKEAERILREWFKFTDQQIADIKSHPTGRLDQIATQVTDTRGKSSVIDDTHTLDDWARRASAEEFNFLKHPDFMPTIGQSRTLLVRQAMMFLGYTYNFNRQFLNKVVAPAARGNLGPVASVILGSTLAAALGNLWREKVMKQDAKHDFEADARKRMFWRVYDSLVMAGMFNFIEHPMDWVNPRLVSGGVFASSLERAWMDALHQIERLPQHASGQYGMGYVGEEAGNMAIKALTDQISLFNDIRKRARAKNVTKNTIDRARAAAAWVAPELQGKTSWDKWLQLAKNPPREWPRKEYEYEVDKIARAIEANDPDAADKAFRDAVEVRSFGEKMEVKEAARKLRDDLMNRSPLAKISDSLEAYRAENNPKLKAFEDRLIAAGKGGDAKQFLAAHEYWMSYVVASSRPWVDAPGIVPEMRPKE